MKIRNNNSLPAPRVSQLLRLPRWFVYLFSIAITLFTLWVRTQIIVDYEKRTLMLLFMLPVIISAYLGGFWAGLLSTLITAIIVFYFIIPPARSFEIAQSYDLIQFLVLLTSGVLISVLNESLHRSRRRAEEAGLARSEMEQALYASEEKYRDLVENSQTLICTHDLAGNILSVNEAVVQASGYSREVLLRTNVKQTIISNIEEQFAAYIEKITMHGYAIGTMQVRIANGEVRTWAYENTLRSEGLAEPIVRGFAQDITERIRVEQENAKLTRFPAENPNPVLRVDLDGRLVYANKASAPLLELWGCEVNGYLPQEYAERISASIASSHNWADLPCNDRIFSMMITPIHEESYVNIYATDITERKRAENLLRESEANLSSLIENTDGSIWAVDKQYGLIVGNREFHSNVSAVLGRHLKMGESVLLPNFPPQANAEWQGYYDRALQGEHFTNETQTRFQEMPHCIEYRFSPIREETGEIRGVTIFGRDITERKQAEQTLKESEARFSKIFHAGPIGINIFRLSDSRSFDVNDAFLNIIGYSREEVFNHSAAELNLFVDPQARMMWVNALRERKGVRNQDAKIRQKSGKIRDTLASIDTIDINGEKMGLVIVVDITERKLMEESLRVSEEKFRLAFDTSPDAITITRLADGVYVSVNKGFEVISGYSREQVIGKSSLEINMWKRPEDRNQMVEELQAYGKIQNFEATLLMSDTEIHSLVSAVIIELDGVPHLLAITRDITERKQAEEKLKYQAHLLANVNDAIVASDKNYNLTAWNAAAETIYGWKASEVLGRKGTEVIQTIFSDQDKEKVLASISANGFYRGEATQIRKDGSRFPVDISSIVLHDNQGQITGYVSVNRDITERKLAQEQLFKTLEELQRSNSELEQFAYVASHDLQEPLRAVAGMVQLLQKRYRGKMDERADEYIGLAMDGANRMQTLITDLLEYSRVDRRGNPIQPTDANEALRSALHNLHGAIQQSGATVTNGTLPTVEADATQITQLFQNLIGNAIKFRNENPPQIHIGVEELPDAWHFSVRDNGIGIEPQYFERIFLVFQRLHTRREYPGTGIGLSICKKIVERHGGRIWVESEPGQGTTFHFTIPHRS